MPAAIAKMVIEGTALDQTIVSVLYYGGEDGLPANDLFDPAVLEAMAAAWAEENADLWAAMLPDTFTLDYLRMSSLNDRGVTISDNEVLFAVGVPGARDDASDGLDNYIVMRQANTSAYTEVGGSVKRSYVAYGPIGSEFIENNKDLTLGGETFANAVLPIFTTPLTVGLNDFAPVRLARRPDPLVKGLGIVTAASWRRRLGARESRRD